MKDEVQLLFFWGESGCHFEGSKGRCTAVDVWYTVILAMLWSQHIHEVQRFPACGSYSMSCCWKRKHRVANGGLL